LGWLSTAGIQTLKSLKGAMPRELDHETSTTRNFSDTTLFRIEAGGLTFKVLLFLANQYTSHSSWTGLVLQYFSIAQAIRNIEIL
jgi:hypothetical protein